MKKFFNPNWRLINQVIKEENLTELRKAQKDLEKKIQKKTNDHYLLKKQQERDQLISELKSLPEASDVYYIGSYENDMVKFGSRMIKYGDGRTRMKVAFPGDKPAAYTVPYLYLQKDPPTEQQYNDHRLGRTISAIFNQAINT